MCIRDSNKSMRSKRIDRFCVIFVPSYSPRTTLCTFLRIIIIIIGILMEEPFYIAISMGLYQYPDFITTTNRQDFSLIQYCDK